MHSPASLRSLKQVKAAARSVVAMTSGLLAGAQQVRGSNLTLPPDLQFDHPAIDAFLSSVPKRLQLGESRLYVTDPELLAADAVLAAVEAAHRSAVLLECKRLYFACSEIQGAAAALAVAEAPGDKR